MRLPRRKVLRRILLALGAVILLVLAEEIAFRIAVPQVRSQGRNAIWLRHSWVGDSHSQLDYKALASRLNRLKITDIYQHTGPLNADGSVDAARISYATQYIHEMTRLAPGVRPQAWLGQVEAKAGGPLDLSKQATRQNVVRTAKGLLDMGFDGIHIDIEPIRSGDTNFLLLMRALHALTRSRGAVLSVSACCPEPVPGIERMAGIVARCPGYWRRDYFIRVAREVDQVAVMTYDMGAPLPGIYGRTVAWTVDWCIDNGVNDLLIGIPTYDSSSLAHRYWVENPGSAINGLKRGVARLNPKDRGKVGAAIYAEWTMSADEEATVRREWL